MSIEAMKKALDVLETFQQISDFAPAQAAHAITELREAIAATKKAAPVAWSPRYSYFGYETQRAWCNGVPRPQDVDYYSRLAGGIDYAYATPPDTAAMLAEKDALLRQALEALENGARVRNAEGGTKYQPPIEEAAIEAIRTHLGVKNERRSNEEGA